jgi:hypothetical protein
MLLALAAPGMLAAQSSLGLSPMRLDLKMAPGALQSGSLTLGNESSDPQRIRTELLDFYVDDTATPQFVRSAPKEAPYSCRDWLSVNPMEMALEPKASIRIRYSFRVPQDAAPGSHYCAVGFTTAPSAEQIFGSGLRVAIRVVAVFYIQIGNEPINGTVKEIKLEPAPAPSTKEVKVESAPAKTQWRAVVVLENRGLAHFRPSGELALLDATGKVVETHEIVPLAVLPKREQRFPIPLNAVLEGPYTLRVRVDLGTHEIQEATVVVEPKR